MTEEERAEDLKKTQLSMGLLRKDIMLDMRKRDRGKPKRPYIILDDEAADLALQAAVPDPIEIDDDNDDNDNDNDNNNPDDDLFSTDSDDERHRPADNERQKTPLTKHLDSSHQSTA